MSIDCTPGTILTRLEGTGYLFMSGSTKGIGGTLTIITHGSWLLAPLATIIFKFFKDELVEDVIQRCSLPFEFAQSD
jgi:hypothetical protein